MPMHIYTHTYTYIHDTLCNHIHAHGILTGNFKPTCPKGHKIHVLAQIYYVYTIHSLYRTTCIESMCVHRKETATHLSHTGIGVPFLA